MKPIRALRRQYDKFESNSSHARFRIMRDRVPVLSEEYLNTLFSGQRRTSGSRPQR